MRKALISYITLIAFATPVYAQLLPEDRALNDLNVKTRYVTNYCSQFGFPLNNLNEAETLLIIKGEHEGKKLTRYDLEALNSTSTNVQNFIKLGGVSREIALQLLVVEAALDPKSRQRLRHVFVVDLKTDIEKLKEKCRSFARTHLGSLYVATPSRAKDCVTFCSLGWHDAPDITDDALEKAGRSYDTLLAKLIAVEE